MVIFHSYLSLPEVYHIFRGTQVGKKQPQHFDSGSVSLFAMAGVATFYSILGRSGRHQRIELFERRNSSIPKSIETYPLVICYIAMENDHYAIDIVDFPSYNMMIFQFAILNYQRVQ